MDNETIICETYTRVSSRGYFHGDDPLQVSTTLVFLQIILVTLLSAVFELILKPFGQHGFVPQLLGGIALGPSLFGRNEKFHKKFFPPRGVMVVDVFELVGLLLFFFLLSVRMDLSMLKKCGRLSVVIGISSFLFPITIAVSMALLIRDKIELGDDIHATLPVVASLESTTSFHVILVLLTDLKLLNSELGRIALSSSMISGISSWCYLIVAGFVKDYAQLPSRKSQLLTQLSKLFVIIVIIFVLRPIMIWMKRQTPEGKSLKESYLCAITLMVFCCSFFGEVTGNHYLIGPIVLGMATPDRPPMESTLSEKMGCFVSAVLIPCYLINVGRKIDVYLMGYNTFLVLELLNFIAIFGKTIAILIPSLYYKMPLMDALSLGLLLNCKGLYDVQSFDRAREVKLITEESYGIMVLTAIVHSAILVPLVKVFYNPSRRYVAYNRRTIQHTGQNSELRILACVYEQDNVSAITCILEASNPTRLSPLAVCVLHLKELVGRTVPLVITHEYTKLPSFKRQKISRVANAFYKYAEQNEGNVKVQCFTAIAPFATMDDDICSLALEKDSCILIIPSSNRPLIRAVNKNVLEKAPCSVGIFCIRGTLMDCRSIISSRLTIRICVVFLGGPDDREALAYGARMAKHPNIRLTVLHLASQDQPIGDLIERRLDMNLINDFRIKNFDNQHVVYREERVAEGSDTTRILSNIGNDFDLILVGRRHDMDSPLLGGLSMWSEIEELGVVGDLLASPDFDCNASVLVMQQQASVVEKMIHNPRSLSSQFYSRSLLPDRFWDEGI